jgi:hypothetical protein
MAGARSPPPSTGEASLRVANRPTISTEQRRAGMHIGLTCKPKEIAFVEPIPAPRHSSEPNEGGLVGDWGRVVNQTHLHFCREKSL